MFSAGITLQKYWVLRARAAVLQTSDTASGVSQVYGKEFRMGQGVDGPSVSGLRSPDLK